MQLFSEQPSSSSAPKIEPWVVATLCAIREGVITINRHGRLTFINESAEKMTGWTSPEALGRPIQDVLHLHQEGLPAAADALISRAMQEGAALEMDAQYVLQSREGRLISIRDRLVPIRDERGSVAGIVIILRDCTEEAKASETQRRLEQKLEDGQRLQSLGVLSSGIAHDFNNLLGAITGNASLLREDFPPDSPDMSFLDEIEMAAFRAASLCKQMLDYAGRRQSGTVEIELSQLVTETVQLVQAAIGKNATLVTEFADDLPLLAGDRGQIQQVIMNLLINAAEALGGGAGMIRVSTQHFVATPDFLQNCQVGGNLEPGSYPLLEVTDGGAGMSEETLSRVFDPFFSTKLHGRGLGLATVSSIVRSHHGALSVESTPGRGTTFRIIFAQATDLTPVTVDHSIPSFSWTSEGRALLVDDEDAMRKAGSGLLEILGFTTTVSENGLEALEVVNREGKDLRLVVMDVTMPLMNGVMAFDHMRRSFPELPILLISGYNKEDAARHIAGDPNAAFLQKPFNLDQFRSTIRGLLDPVDSEAEFDLK